MSHHHRGPHHCHHPWQVGLSLSGLGFAWHTSICHAAGTLRHTFACHTSVGTLRPFHARRRILPGKPRSRRQFFLPSTLSPFTQPCTKNFRSRHLFRGGRDFCSKTFLLKGAVGKEGRMGMARRLRRILYPLFLAENKRKSRSYFSPSPFWF